MLAWLFFLFVAIPLADLIVLLRIGEVLHFWPTLTLVILTGMAGAALARRQGLRTLARVQESLATGQMPGRELADGAIILLAAALLVTPGFLTDVFGLLLLIPPVRALFRGALASYFKRRIVVTGISRPMSGEPFDPFPGQPARHVRNEAIREVEGPSTTGSRC